MCGSSTLSCFRAALPQSSDHPDSITTLRLAEGPVTFSNSGLRPDQMRRRARRFRGSTTSPAKYPQCELRAADCRTGILSTADYAKLACSILNTKIGSTELVIAYLSGGSNKRYSVAIVWGWDRAENGR